MTLKCYVIDDEKHAIDVLVRHISNSPDLELIGTELNPLNALRKIGDGELSPDIAFVDIDMPQLTGIDLAGLIGNRTLIIFTTAYGEYAATAFDKNAVDYMLKPISYERFLKSVDKARQLLYAGRNQEAGTDGSFFIKTEVKGKLTKIIPDEIVYVESKLNYVEINLDETKHLTYLTLQEVEDRLPKSIFLRAHKSYVINIRKIKVIEGDIITFSCGKQVTMGVSYKAQVLASIDPLIFKSKRN